MYDELVKRLKNCISDEIDCAGCPYQGGYKGTYCMNGLVLEAADAIEELSKPRWIPVAEALPECDLGAEVGNIEWISCGMVHAGCFGRGGKYRDAYFRTWTDAGEGMDAKDADYWRAVTLPEPQKEEA